MMASLIERLSARAGKKNPGKAQFLALQEEISKALEAGWSIKEIWRQLHEDRQVTIQYAQFASYVRTLIYKQQDRKKIERSGSNSSENKNGGYVPNKKESPKKFTHNPTPSKELLEMLHGTEEEE